MRVAILASIFIVPLALLSYFYIKQNTDNVVFTKVERVGVDYLPALQSAFLRTTSTRDHASNDAGAPASLEGPDALSLGVADRAKAADTALASAPPGSELSDLTAKVGDLISAMNDSSNLSLDPDLDAYYLQDALINQVDTLLVNAQLLHEVIANETGRPLSVKARLAIAADEANFVTAAGAFASDVKKASSADQTGEFSAKLSGAIGAISSANAALAAAADANDVAATEASAKTLHAAVAEFVPAGDAILDKMLVKRIDGIYGTLTWEMAIVAALFALGGVFALFTARSIIRPVRALSAAMDTMSSGNLSVEVPGHARRDEIGAMAASVEKFRGNLFEAERAATARMELIVGSIGAGLAAMAGGDFTVRVTADLAGPLAKLKDDFNAAVSRLGDAIRGVLSATTSISTGAGEISRASDDLSRRTEQQAASLEQTAAALEEITATVKKTAANAIDASRGVEAAKSAAESGGQIVNATVEAMGQIDRSSRRMSDIIGVIDEIAFQTNLLALNAGVEAARAGAAGAGFAVVASEVRALAQRSGEASREIKSLIKGSGELVASGVALVGQSAPRSRRSSIASRTSPR